MIRNTPSALAGALILVSTLTLPSSARAEYNLSEELKRFHANPKAFMEELPPTFETKTVGEAEQEQTIFSRLPDTSLHFSEQEIKSGDFVDRKVDSDETAGTFSGRAGIRSHDQAADLVDFMEKYPGGLKLRTLAQIEKAQLLKGKASTAPWSGDYYPFYQGSIAFRYADKNFPDSSDWQENANYVFHNSCSVDDLSPAEKYDLLIGDTNRTLTKAMLKEGMPYAGASFDPTSGFSGGTKDVPAWPGNCHGWSAASFMEKRPYQTLPLQAVDGTMINFYPDDIKALATLMWAKGKRIKFVGKRCPSKKPKTDENGRILDPACFETNPASWHLAVVNQIGVNKRNFVFDATLDYRIWNQPAYSYSYTYFNPLTDQPRDKLKDAMISINHPGFKDKFQKYRSPKAKYLVGISMSFVYIAETSPDHERKDKRDYDRQVTVQYLYDLELDEEGVIIGGEWYQQKHPGFMWTPIPNFHPVSLGDQWLKTNGDHSFWRFKRTNAVPKRWRDAAIRYSSPNKQPLSKIVNAMLEKSARIGGGIF